MRKYEISCAIIIQNMAQLETMYKESWKTIVGNCDEFIYLGGHESSSTEYVSKMLGKQTIKSRNSSKTYGRQGSSNISLNATGRELMTPDEIAHMSDQDCLVMVKGVMPFFDKKYDLLKHPNYQFTGDADDDLIFNIAEEIQTPQNNVFGNKQANERRKLEQQAKEDTRVHDRRTPVGRPKASPLAISQENLEEAGIYNNVFNQDDSMFGDIEVTAANAPADEFQMPADMEAATAEGFDSFLGEDVISNIDDNDVLDEAAVMGSDDIQDDLERSFVTDAVLHGSREGDFINHLRVLNDIDFVILDTETTGLENDDEIVELGVIDKFGNMLYSSLFRNQKPVHPKAAEKNHLSEEELADAPLFTAEWEKIKKVLHDKKIIAFNTEFDYRLFRQTLIRYDLNPDEVDVYFDGYLDAMKIYLDIKPNGRKRISLQDCCDALGMKVKESHRAVDDCRLTLDMLRSVDKVKTNTAPLDYLETLTRI